MNCPMLRRPSLARLGSLALLAIFAFAAAGTDRRLVGADAPRVLPQGQLPKDKRLGPLKDLDGYFPFGPSASLDAWKVRAERLRRQLLVATGVWPMPAKTPANAVIHGKVDRDGYTVEKVFLESFPGHFVTGSLYRPKGRTGKLPGVLSPHGHWPNGRFYRGPRQRVPLGFGPRGGTVRDRRPLSRCRPAACRWPGWAASSSITTWWAMPTACN